MCKFTHLLQIVRHRTLRQVVSNLSVMIIIGHQTEKQFLKYIRITPSEHAEKLRALWDGAKAYKSLSPPLLPIYKILISPKSFAYFSNQSLWLFVSLIVWTENNTHARF